MIMIEGTDGIIIVDTTESGDVALQILEEFRKITSKPIKAIIQTHFHSDHINGTAPLLETCGDDRENVMVIAHSTLFSELTRAVVTLDSISMGGIQQLGMILKQNSERICCGLGPFYTPYNQKDKLKPQFVKPTHTFDKNEEYKIAGVKIHVLHTPGETDDQITVWIPEWKVVMPADNIYRTFPNLYAIRGSPPRDCVKWYQSLDVVRRLGAHHMVPSHTEPVTGAKKIYDIITHYRDAIQFINDQTVRHLNNGMDVDDIVEKVKLPPSLADYPYLQQHYGMVPWSVRSVAAGHIGWFDKKTTNLFPISFETRAENVEQLLSNCSSTSSNAVDKLLDEAEKIINDCQAQSKSDDRETEKKVTWSLELSLQAKTLSTQDSVQQQRAEDIALKCMNCLASLTMNPNARNFFITKSKELKNRNLLSIFVIKKRNDKVSRWPIEMLTKLRVER